MTNKWKHFLNAVESGVDLNARLEKVIVPKSSKHACSVQKGPRDHITFIVCCSSPGQGSILEIASNHWMLVF